jgi:hypothetical protein
VTGDELQVQQIGRIGGDAQHLVGRAESPPGCILLFLTICPLGEVGQGSRMGHLVVLGNLGGLLVR